MLRILSAYFLLLLLLTRCGTPLDIPIEEEQKAESTARLFHDLLVADNHDSITSLLSSGRTREHDKSTLISLRKKFGKLHSYRITMTKKYMVGRPPDIKELIFSFKGTCFFESDSLQVKFNAEKHQRLYRITNYTHKEF